MMRWIFIRYFENFLKSNQKPLTMSDIVLLGKVFKLPVWELKDLLNKHGYSEIFCDYIQPKNEVIWIK